MNKKKNIIAGIIGNIIEYYDFGIYIVFSEIIEELYIKPVFLEKVSSIVVFFIFAIGFFFRPLGGIIFGHIGDKLGRKVSLSISTAGMVISTMTIAFLPTYSKIGVLAPALLIIVRVLQGICIGGESTGSAVFVIEHCGFTRVGLWGGIVMSSNVIGSLLSLLFALLIERLFGINDFTWRLGFVFGTVLGVLGFVLRINSSESPVFQNIKKSNKISVLPVRDILCNRFQSIILLASLSGVASSSTYIIRGYFLKYLEYLTGGCMLHLVCLSLLSLIIFLPIFGYLSDTIKIHNYLYSVIVLYVLILVPFFNFLRDINNLSLFVILFGIIAAAVSASYYAYAIKFFAPEIRYSGISLSWNLGNAIFGGTTPLICSFIVHYTRLKPEHYLMFISILFLAISFFNRKNNQFI